MSNTEHTPHARRQLIFVLLGLFLFTAAGLLINDRLHVHSDIAPGPDPYKYDITQSVKQQTYYRENSFFGTRPDQSNGAFLTDLTKSIDTQFHYNFNASQTTKLSYRYAATAELRALYGSDTSEKNRPTVWQKQFKLLEPVEGVQQTNQLALQPEVQIPFAKYKQEMEQFKNAFSAPLDDELIITYRVIVEGSTNNTPFQDTKVSTITIPLDQQVFTLATKFKKTDHNEIIPKHTQQIQDTIARFEIPVAIGLIIFGVAYFIYGLRRQLIKSPYQRELEKIYRYHDGIIIHAGRPSDLAHKNVVTVKSFDDLLNLEEEMKTPIIASQVSGDTTHFFISHNDEVYVYTLGVPIPFKTPVPTRDTPYSHHKQPVPKQKIMG